MIDPIDEDVEAERLRQVRALLEDVLREHDVCAQVIIAGRAGRFENFTHLAASWCKARLEHHEGKGDFVGVRSKLVDYDGDVERQQQELAWTAGVVSGFAEIGGQVAISWIEAAKYVDKAARATHTPLRPAGPVVTTGTDLWRPIGCDIPMPPRDFV